MTDKIICRKCGAPQSSFREKCSYCLAQLIKNEKSEIGILSIAKGYFLKGELPRSLNFLETLAKEKPEESKQADYIILYLRILIEMDGPQSKMRTLLANGLVNHPENKMLLEIQEIFDAREKLKKGPNDAGELALRDLLLRSPDNYLALFTLASHMFWSDGDTKNTPVLLERCVRIRPVFVRAWGCLGAIYKTVGKVEQSRYAFQMCIKLENSEKMKKFYLEQIGAGQSREILPSEKDNFGRWLGTLIIEREPSGKDILDELMEQLFQF